LPADRFIVGSETDTLCRVSRKAQLRRSRQIEPHFARPIAVSLLTRSPNGLPAQGLKPVIVVVTTRTSPPRRLLVTICPSEPTSPRT